MQTLIKKFDVDGDKDFFLYTELLFKIQSNFGHHSFAESVFLMLCIFYSLLQFQMCNKIWWLAFYVRTITNYVFSLSSFYFIFCHSIFLSLSLSLYFVSPLIFALHTGLLVTDYADSQNVNMYLNLNEYCDSNWLFHLLLICFSCINQN